MRMKQSQPLLLLQVKVPVILLPVRVTANQKQKQRHRCPIFPLESLRWSDGDRLCLETWVVVLVVLPVKVKGAISLRHHPPMPPTNRISPPLRGRLPFPPRRMKVQGAQVDLCEDYFLRQAPGGEEFPQALLRLLPPRPPPCLEPSWKSFQVLPTPAPKKKKKRYQHRHCRPVMTRDWDVLLQLRNKRDRRVIWIQKMTLPLLLLPHLKSHFRRRRRRCLLRRLLPISIKMMMIIIIIIATVERRRRNPTSSSVPKATRC